MKEGQGLVKFNFSVECFPKSSLILQRFPLQREMQILGVMLMCRFTGTLLTSKNIPYGPCAIENLYQMLKHFRFSVDFLKPTSFILFCFGRTVYNMTMSILFIMNE